MTCFVTKTSFINKKLTEIQNKQRIQSPTKAQLKWQDMFPQKEFKWESIFYNAFKICKDNTLQNFHLNFLHRNIASNKYLFQCKLIESSLCDFCNMAVECMDHMFWNYDKIQHFWHEIFVWLETINVNAEQNKFTVFFHTDNQKVSYI